MKINAIDIKPGNVLDHAGKLWLVMKREFVQPGKLENGRRVMVPPHVGPGTRIVVNTADGSYVERAKD